MCWKVLVGRVNPPEAQQTIAPITFFSNTEASQRRAHIPDAFHNLQGPVLLNSSQLSNSFLYQEVTFTCSSIPYQGFYCSSENGHHAF